MSKRFWLPFVGYLVILLVFESLTGFKTVKTNWASLLSMWGLMGNPEFLPAARISYDDLVDQDCRARWFAGNVAAAQQDSSARDASLRALIICHPEYALMVRAAQPKNRELGTAFAALYPMEAWGWFWLAEAVRDSDPVAAIEHYRHGLNLDPKQGVAWCGLGNILEKRQDLQAARESFANCCTFGDPDLTGCWNAGKISEELGDLPAAIHFYRTSGRENAHERARELEGLLAPQK